MHKGADPVEYRRGGMPRPSEVLWQGKWHYMRDAREAIEFVCGKLGETPPKNFSRRTLDRKCRKLGTEVRYLNATALKPYRER